MEKIDLPPVAHNTICVDFDGTIFQWGDVYAVTPPFDGCIEFMRELRKQGWYIVIFTSRMSPTWWASEGRDFDEALKTETDWVEGRLREFGIPFDRITSEKVPAEFYIDDKAVRFHGNWKEISRMVLG